MDNVPLILSEQYAGNKYLDTGKTFIKSYWKIILVAILILLVLFYIMNKNTSTSSGTSISLQKTVDESGNVTYSKIVNGEKLELTEEDVEKMNLTIEEANKTKEDALKLGESIRQEVMQSIN